MAILKFIIICLYIISVEKYINRQVIFLIFDKQDGGKLRVDYKSGKLAVFL